MSTSYKRLSFTNDEEEALIKFIKKHPALWDASHVEYGNGELRKVYWATIAKNLSKSVLECRRKWRFIRDYYIHKRRRVNESTPQRDGKYFNLHFLDKVHVRRFSYPQRSNPSNLECNKPNKDNQFIVDDLEADYNYTSDVTFEKVTMERMDQGEHFLLDDEDGVTSQDQDTNDDPHADGGDNEEYTFDQSSIVHVCGIEQKLEENEEEHLVETHFDTEVEPTKRSDGDVSKQEKAIDLFFESMAAAVKTFPPQFVAEAKFKVFTAINELEMRVHSTVNGK